MKDLLKQFYVIGFRFKIGFHFIRVWASAFNLTFNSMMKGCSSLKRIKGLAGTWRLTLDKTGGNKTQMAIRLRGRAPGGYPWETLVGVCRPFLQILTLITAFLHTIKCVSPY